jgi:serine/threonine-protein kinase
VIGSVLRIRYELTQALAEGPIFRTFAAHDKVQSREVSIRVVKEPFAADPEFIEKLGDVLKRVGSIRHPVLEELYEVDSDESTSFIVGQAIRGSSLGERLRKLATFSVPASVEAAISICDGLSTLHRSNIAHGEITSQTIWMQPDGEVRIQMPDFWEAYIVNDKAKEAYLISSAAYLAPEVSRGGLPTPASDVYSVGVLLFELVTGRQPFRGDTAVAMAIQHATEPPPSAKSMNPSVPQSLDQMIKKALAKRTDERYADASELLSDLRMLQDALRFGKTLNWPLSGASPEAAEPIVPVVKKKESEPKAPTLARPKREPKEERESDVPVWIKVAIAFVAGLVCVFVGIFFYTNFQQAKKIVVPHLAHLNSTEAASRLQKLGFRLGTTRTETNDQFGTDTVISTTPIAGETEYENSQVSLLVSSGSKFVEVPDLRGVTLDKAKGMLGSLDLQLDDNVEQARDRHLEAGLIISQTPAPRAKFERNTRVHVVVSTGKEAVRDDSGNDTKYVYNIRIKLSDIDQPVTLRVDMTDSKGTKTLVEQKYDPNSDVPVSAEGYGKQVTFRIFYNNELVKQVPVQADESNDNNGDNQT